jgi:GNAT superfamily N-acetyltransferase
VALLRDDILGEAREVGDMDRYVSAFRSMSETGCNRLVVGELDGQVVACYQIVFIDGLSLSASRRAELEGVRVAKSMRGQGLGAKLIEDAIVRAKAANCKLVQLTANQARHDAHRFYEGHGFVKSHFGFKLTL